MFAALYRALLFAYPRDFRDRFGDELLVAFLEGFRSARSDRARGARWCFSITLLVDAAISAGSASGGRDDRRSSRQALSTTTPAVFGKAGR